MYIDSLKYHGFECLVESSSIFPAKILLKWYKYEHQLKISQDLATYSTT